MRRLGEADGVATGDEDVEVRGRAVTRGRERRLTQEEAAQLLGVCRADVPALRRPLRGVGPGRSGWTSGCRRYRRGGRRWTRCCGSQALYRESYQGWSVAHFHDRYRERHAGRALVHMGEEPAAGVGAWCRRAKRGARRGVAGSGRRSRGLLLHQDGSTHKWVAGAEWDLIVTMDDATSEVYSGFFVEEEGTWSSLPGGAARRSPSADLFCSLYTDRGSHYWHTPTAGGQGGPRPTRRSLGGRWGSSGSR